MRRVYLAYLDRLCQPRSCPRQANRNRTVARLKYCKAFDKLAWEKPYALGAESII